ncbi:hypothetical protein BU23DRAFT_560338 [Bimuria novae-zelandiae CBS 107.79]|uniref:Glycosyltransferase family 25 protein n=1 Tax=Bimuria novae-zelandiae CBS 107.79 TaxID=1447943 RepID=A0A6A5UTT1_9PLEO|nr:hypothetical protein BU23DRAFT_560338 [Bimuria novae-zelandiae CBS 107.79]
MLAPSRKRPVHLLASLAITTLLLFYYRHTDRIYLRWPPSLGAQDVKLLANRTLGFGAVVVVSNEGSKRRHALLQAANVTDFDLTIPQQPQWTDNDVENFRGGQVDGVQHGSILAWMGHHNALRWFLESGLETALILEDDVDWDIRLRSIQIPLAASATRTLMPLKRLRNFFTRQDRNLVQYWGDHGAWDLLYLGHCGDYFNRVTYEGLDFNGRSFTLKDVEHFVYNDPTLPAPSELHPFTQDLFGALGMPEHARALHRSKFPLCSFGYAVTRPAAQRLLNHLAPPKLKPEGPRAFDVALLHACLKEPSATSSTSSSQPDRGLRCWTLNSELFHHMPGESEIAKVGKTMGEEAGQGLSPIDWAGQTQAVFRNETTNIACGFWSGAFAFDDGDDQRLDFLREEVGRKGRCLKHGQDAT